ncbi:type II toxin-antitoxin system RelE/ParE family toxin [Methylomonas rosea]|uniref:type II toxin-antitoxin system RelE/ParE family toxin n=1 Tax=Methylomonas rosea TaxID=2952227 RepID=UPI003531B795
MVIVWSKPAREDLHSIHQFIARDSKQYANHVARDILAKVDVLTTMPKLGRTVSEAARLQTGGSATGISTEWLNAGYCQIA